jgi:hypothetical protein
MSGFYLQSYRCFKCKESDCELCPGNRCSQCLDGYKLTESGRCLSLGNGVLYLAGAIIGILFITVAAIFCCLYNWKKIKAFFNQHFKSVAESQKVSSGPKGNKVVPVSSQHKSTSNLDDSKLPIANASNDEEQVQFKGDTATNAEGKESKAALSGAPDIGLNKLDGEKEHITQEKKPPEDRILKKSDHGILSARNKNSGSDWKLSEDAGTKRGLTKQDPFQKPEPFSELHQVSGFSKSGSKKSIVKRPISPIVDKSGVVSDKSNLQSNTDRQRQSIDPQQPSASPLLPDKQTQPHLVTEGRAELELDPTTALIPKKVIQTEQPIVSRLDQQQPISMPVMAINSTPTNIAATTSKGGIERGQLASISQEKPSDINKTLAKEVIPHLSPTDKNHWIEPNREKPTQPTISKSKHADDSSQRQAADEFVDELFASIVEQS